MIFDDTTNYSAAATTNGNDFLSLFSYGIIIFVVLVALILVWRRFIVYNRARLHRSLDLSFLEIQVPKENAEDKFGQETTKQNEKELIGIAEQLFTTLYFKRAPWWRRFWRGDDVLTFEIACFSKKIHFYITCPQRMVSIIERHIHAQYPKASVEEVEPYRLFKPDQYVAAAEFRLQKHYVYPIKTYDQQNSDPLNAITNAMSKLTPDEAMAMQIVVTPPPRYWDSHPRKLAEEIQQGKRPSDVAIGKFHRASRVVGKTVKMGVENLASDKKGPSKDEKPISLTPMQQEVVKKLEEKASKIGYLTNIRLVAMSETNELADTHVKSMIAALTQYTAHPFNGFKVRPRLSRDVVHDFILRRFKRMLKGMLLNAAELTSIWHPPTKFTETPNIQWLMSRKAAPPPNLPDAGLHLGRS